MAGMCRQGIDIRQLLRTFLAMAGCFLLLTLALKTVEFSIAETELPHKSAKGLQLLVNALAYNGIAASWALLGVGVLHLLIGLLSPKAAKAATATLLGLMLLAETGLMLYTMHNGFLLGSELFARPLGETLMAIRGAMGVALPIVLTLLLLGGFIALSLWLAATAPGHGENCAMGRAGKLQSLRKVLRTVTLVAIVLLPLLSLIFKPSHLLTFGNDNYLVCNKTLYLLAEGRQYRAYRAGNARAEGQGYRMTESEVARLLSTHPEWGTPSDWRYPLERPFVADTSLNRHFTSVGGKRPPSVVVILVESMGNEFMDCQAMPFVDSLAATGLYWPNCLSATTRSYGAIPAITGSVGGPKSFQFGDMPAHNSIISLLKEEGYDTRAYYGGDFTFDCIYEYLTAQGIGYLSPFYDEFRASPDGSHGHWWGAGDDYLFARTMDDLRSRSADRPQFALVTTLSMHDDLDLPDRDRQRAYEQRAKKAAPAARNGKVAARYAAAMLTDDCIRDFIRQYRQLPDYENTIFVITGDHASGLQGGDYLAYHHVPLIVWSPLVKSPQRFDYVVTHNDIAPDADAQDVADSQLYARDNGYHLPQLLLQVRLALHARGPVLFRQHDDASRVQRQGRSRQLPPRAAADDGAVQLHLPRRPADGPPRRQEQLRADKEPQTGQRPGLQLSRQEAERSGRLQIPPPRPHRAACHQGLQDGAHRHRGRRGGEQEHLDARVSRHNIHLQRRTEPARRRQAQQVFHHEQHRQSRQLPPFDCQRVSARQGHLQHGEGGDWHSV